MRILITGSSGQIGTDLALRLQNEGHEVFGVDKRQNTWTSEFTYLLQDLSGQYPAYPTGISGVDYPESDVVIHLAAHAKVHQLVGQLHRALENINLAYGQGFTLLQMTEFIGEALGKTPKLTLSEPLVGEVTHYIADIKKANELLGFQPQVPLSEGIKWSVAWQKEWMNSRC